MTTPAVTTTAEVPGGTSGEVIRARPAGLVHDMTSIAGRALRAVPRDIESVMPPIFIALFFFIVNIATLKKVVDHGQFHGLNYTAFQMGTAILLGVTGVSRAPALVLDIQDRYFDRLLLTPVRRTAILLGHMVADVTVAAALSIPIMILGLALGVSFLDGPLGFLVFIVIASLWSLAFAGFGYAIALKTGNPAAVNSTFLLFFPFLFLTTAYVPRAGLTGWLGHVATFNPVTYLLAGLRSLVLGGGWQWGALGQAFLAIFGVALVSLTLCFGALRGRINKGA
ncbi:MAG TPA: ABC transporter permease [Acidimicrobiales bacterium]|jgi:ABC-2 type transport system permease protein